LKSWAVGIWSLCILTNGINEELAMNTFRNLLVLTTLSATVLLTSCASKESLNLNIYTDPEGAHIVYRVADENMAEDAPWIYLGMTPYQGLTRIDSSSFSEEGTITFKAMRHGYLDQVKKWNGEQFLEEYEQAGQLFWTPRLVKVGK
jgi:hypothetical protein